MKKFIYILIFLTITGIVYNLTQIDYDNVLGKDSIVGLITVVAGLCAILILSILLVSKKIEEAAKKRR